MNMKAIIAAVFLLGPALSFADTSCVPKTYPPIQGVVQQIGYGHSPYDARLNAIELMAMELSVNVSVQLNVVQKHSGELAAKKESWLNSDLSRVNHQQVDSGILCGMYYSVIQMDTLSDQERILRDIRSITNVPSFVNNAPIFHAVKSNLISNSEPKTLSVHVTQFGFELRLTEKTVPLYGNNLFTFVNFQSTGKQRKVRWIEDSNKQSAVTKLRINHAQTLSFEIPVNAEYAHFTLFNVGQDGTAAMMKTFPSDRKRVTFRQYLPVNQRKYEDAYVVLWHNKHVQSLLLSQMSETLSRQNTNALLVFLSNLPPQQWAGFHVFLNTEVTNL